MLLSERAPFRLPVMTSKGAANIRRGRLLKGKRTRLMSRRKATTTLSGRTLCTPDREIVKAP
jgi:hypothetical protein